MDRSVDSIGSCSLDVDADSTDFSDTSGELNFLTPISGKDITREFTAGIKERCMLPVINCQAVTSVLDPVTGHISTVLTTTTAPNSQQAQQQQPLLGGDSSPTAATNKKPSYLNLACCVNGYSNLTTYDSKLRQDINKSREVSPSRPIIATLHYNRTDSGTGGHLLTAPTLSYVSMNNTINNNNNYNSGSTAGIGGNRMLKMNGAGVANGAGGGRIRGLNGSIISPPGGADMTDNAAAIGLYNGNGSFVSSMRTKVISSQSQISSHARDDAQTQLMTPKKSFIQQRVEKLYGASDVVVLNKQNYSSSERKYLNNIANENNGGTPLKMAHQSIGNGAARNGVANGAGGLHVTNGAGTNGSAFVSVDENRQINGEGHVGEDADVDSLPVLRHLRPEFRAQLQIFSPKKVPKSSPNRTVTGSGNTHISLNSNGNVTHANGNAAEENANLLLHKVSKRHQQSNGNSYIDHFEQLSLSREEQMQDLRKNPSDDGTQRSVMKTAQLDSHTTRSTTTNGKGPLPSNGRHTEHEQKEDALKTSNRHHSNTSTRSAELKHTDATEQHHETSQCYRSDSVSSSSVSSSTVIVESKQQHSLVVVSSSVNFDGNGVGRMSTSDGNSAAIATVTTTVPDEQNATTVATSVNENGEQNGTGLSNHSNNNASEGLANVPVAVCTTTVENGIVDKSGSGEIVNCDSNTQLVTVDSMRTVNGGTSTTAVDSAPVVKLTMAAAEENMQSNGKPPASTSLSEATTNGSNGNASNNNTVLDGNHFLRILKTEQKRLRTMADVLEGEINQLKADGVVLGEDINGYILAAVGKARLLCSQKMKQFEDLCYTNLNQSPDEKFQTTGEDLRGFWDMVMLQVNNVDASFDEIDSFRKNGWRKPIPKSPPLAQARNGTAPPRTKLVKRPYKTQTNASNGGSTVTDGSNGVEAKKASAALAAAKREAQRKQLMEMKRKQKLAHSQQQAAVEIFAPSGEEQPAQNGDDNTNCTTSVVTASSPLVDTS
ncbi:homeobox protein 2 [Anopheles marshallii]|uniref:homeobox protein 2 n=1 Tax=Anopheles marshallii TaxID=1521116 RepID=UPI00237AD78E|nr:homeobox protein 2 [Anopheles marshallii]